MFKRLRNLYRKALDHELGVVGDEITRLTGEIDVLGERFDNLQSRVGMRLMRAARKGSNGAEQPDFRELYRQETGQEWPM